MRILALHKQIIINIYVITANVNGICAVILGKNSTN